MVPSAPATVALPMLTIQDFGGWDTAQAAYFADGGMFDRAFTPGR
jgi:sulfate transport system substrate-binding protein